MVRGIVKRGLYSSLAAVAMLAALMFSVSLPAGAEGQDLAKHFSGKTVTIIVGATPGGSYDLFARLVARFVGKYLLGKPAFVVHNIPGGGHLRGLRATMKARPDGLTVGLLHPRWVMRKLTGVDVPDFDLDTVRVLGSPTGIKEPQMTCVRRDIATSWEEVVKLGRPITNGTSSPGGPGLGPEFVQLIGGPIKMVYGYGGASEIMAAFDRGELDSTVVCMETHVPRLFPEWIKKKILAPVFWWGAKPSEDWLRQIGAPMPPHVFDIIEATEDQKKAFEVSSDLNMINRVFIMPPGVPNDIYHAWKRAFEAMVRDPGFVETAGVAGFEVGLATAEEFERTIRTYRELSPAGRRLLKKLVGE